MEFIKKREYLFNSWLYKFNFNNFILLMFFEINSIMICPF